MKSVLITGCSSGIGLCLAKGLKQGGYQVLARKYRPHTFSEMVGQTHTVKTLINALDADSLHHAFLFTGTRGVGKTTIARIFAKSINCEAGVSSKPCGKCLLVSRLTRVNRLI